MYRILGEVSVRKFDGYLKKIMELITDKELGYYWLSQIGQLARQEPTSVLTKKWLKELANKYTWEKAEEHFTKTGNLWFNELEWPFQVCVLKIGGLSNAKLRKKWLKELGHCYVEKKLTEEIENLRLVPVRAERKIFLIRLQARFIGFSQDTTFSEINRNHPEFNLSLCPEETAFFMRPLVKKYPDPKPTIFAMEFCPSTMVDKNKKRVFYFAGDRTYSGDVYMGVWDIFKNSESEPSSNWIFQYNLPIE